MENALKPIHVQEFIEYKYDLDLESTATRTTIEELNGDHKIVYSVDGKELAIVQYFAETDSRAYFIHQRKD